MYVQPLNLSSLIDFGGIFFGGEGGVPCSANKRAIIYIHVANILPVVSKKIYILLNKYK